MKLNSVCVLSVGLLALTLVGCATIKQAKDDVATGYTTPLQAGEVAPQEQARPIAGSVTGAITTLFPVAAPIATPLNEGLAGLLGLFFAWQRGRSIRKQQPISPNPITGFLGNKVGLEAVVQNVSTTIAGVTEVFTPGSSAQHAWQGVLTGLAGLVGTALAVPEVGRLLASNPSIALWVPALTGLANGIQQSLTQIKPVATTGN